MSGSVCCGADDACGKSNIERAVAPSIDGSADTPLSVDAKKPSAPPPEPGIGPDMSTAGALDIGRAEACGPGGGAPRSIEGNGGGAPPPGGPKSNAGNGWFGIVGALGADGGGGGGGIPGGSPGPCGPAKLEKSNAAGVGPPLDGGAMAAKSNGEAAGAAPPGGTNAGTVGALGIGGLSELKSKGELLVCATAGTAGCVAGYAGALGGTTAGGTAGTRAVPNSALRLASTPSAKTPGRVTSAFGGSDAAPNFAKGSAPPAAAAGLYAGKVPVAGCAMSRVTRKV